MNKHELLNRLKGLQALVRQYWESENESEMSAIWSQLEAEISQMIEELENI